MITYVDGDVFRSAAGFLVCPVNTVGEMDHGLALEFKKRGPKLYKAYRDLCELGQLRVGTLFVYKTRSRSIVCFPIRETLEEPVELETIEQGLQRMAGVFEEFQFEDMAIPRLGCDKGGLKWDDVKPLMEKYLQPIQAEFSIYNHKPELHRPGGSLHPRFGNGDCLIFA